MRSERNIGWAAARRARARVSSRSLVGKEGGEAVQTGGILGDGSWQAGRAVINNQRKRVTAPEQKFAATRARVMTCICYLLFSSYWLSSSPVSPSGRETEVCPCPRKLFSARTCMLYITLFLPARRGGGARAYRLGGDIQIRTPCDPPSPPAPAPPALSAAAAGCRFFALTLYFAANASAYFCFCASA